MMVAMMVMTAKMITVTMSDVDDDGVMTDLLVQGW